MSGNAGVLTLKRCSRGDQCVHPGGCLQPATPEYFRRKTSRNGGLDSQCKSCVRMRDRRYVNDNADKVREKNRQWASRNAEKLHENFKRWKSENVERKLEYNRQWDAKNTDRTREYRHRRYSAAHNLPSTFTTKDWRSSLNYFNGCCAVCGRPLRDLFGTHKPAADHWIALSDTRPGNPGTVPTNIVPLCHGVGGCNNRKSNRDPVEFLETEFGKRKAAQILKRINAYFSSLTAQENAA